MTDEADVATQLGAARHSLAQDLDIATGGPRKTRDHAKQRRLAGAIRSEQGDRFAASDVQIDAA